MRWLFARPVLVPDQQAALAEIARVLSQAALLFLEHVAATPAGRLKWQRRVEPV